MKLKAFALVLGFSVLGACGSIFSFDPLDNTAAAFKPDYSDILIEFLPKDSELLKSNYINTVQAADLDADGKLEIVGAYRMADIKNAVFLVVLKMAESGWNKEGTIKGDGYELDLLDFADVEGNGNKNILFGTKIGSAYSKLNVFTMKNSNLEKVFSKTYSKLEIIQANSQENKNNRAVLAVWTKDTAEAYKTQVVRWDGMELVPAKDIYKSYYKRVVQYYEEKVKYMPDAAFYWYYLAEAQGRSGQKKDALKSIARGLSLNQDYPTKQQFEQLKSSIR